MEEATMSQHAEMTATDSLEAAELGGTPTQSVKKPSRFSADAFRALSNKLNGNSTPVAETQPEQPAQNGQIIPELGLELDPNVGVVPSGELPSQQIPIIANPGENIANGAETIVAELTNPETVVNSPAPVMPVADTIVHAAELADFGQAGLEPEPILEPTPLQQPVVIDPIVPDVAVVEDNIGNEIPQFSIPQVEIPNFSTPPAQDIVPHNETIEVVNELPQVVAQPAFVEQSLPEQVLADQSPTDQSLVEQNLVNQVPVDQLPIDQVPVDQVIVEPAPFGNVAEPDFLNLAQFTQAEPDSNMAPIDPAAPIVEMPDQILQGSAPLEETIQSPSTNVGSLSLAEMLAAEPQVAIEQPIAVVQEAQLVEPAMAPAVVEALEEKPQEVNEEIIIQASVPAPQVDVSQTVEPIVETPAPEILPEVLPEISMVKAEPSLDDLFANQAQLENQQPAFSVPVQEQLNAPIAAQTETQPELPQELPRELPVEVQPELAPEIPQEIQPDIELHLEPQSGSDITEPDHQFDLQAAIDAQATPDISVHLNKEVPNLAADGSTPEVAQVAVPEIVQVTVQETAPLLDIEPAPTPEFESLLQDDQISVNEPFASETEVPAQAEPVLENELDLASLVPAPIDTPTLDTPTIDAGPAVTPNFSPQGGLDPLLEAMRLMQEVGPTPSQVTEVTDVEAAENDQEKIATQVDVAEPINENEPVSETRKIDEPELDPAPGVSAKVKSSEPVEIVEADVDPEYELELEPDEKSGETARALLDMMSGAGGAAQPQERALAGDTLLQLVPRMLEKDLVSLSERVGMMDEPPALLVNKLINNRSARVAQPLLEGGQVVSDQDLLKLITKCEVDRLTMISKRRIISSGVCDALIGRGEASVYLTLVRNPGASISHDAFISLCEIAKNQQTLQAPLATRGDTPPPIAFELFWALPVELRRYVLSRFLTDSATLDKILKIAQSMGNDGDVEAAGDQHFPTRRKVDELVDLIAEGVIDGAVDMLATLAEIQPENARRIVTDPDGEPLTVALKTLGISRAKFNKAIKLFSTTPSAPLSAERDLQELQAMFDGLSHNKARTLMKYWDWAVEKSGPYARRSA